MSIHVKVKLAEGAHVPTYAHDDDTGADLRALVKTTVWGGQTVKVRTGVHLQPPTGWAFVVRPRSGLSAKGIVVTPGTIDSGYRGEISVVVTNHGDDPYVIQAGDKIAQLVLERVHQATFSVTHELEDSARGDGGFGSTGK